MARPDSGARERILQSALRQFAERGYAGASVQRIAADARLTKPALYYHFESKAGLYRALIDWAGDARHRLMQSAAARADDLPGKLIEITRAVFNFVRQNRELTRLAFATVFSASGETPREAKCLESGRRNFEFVHDLIRAAHAEGRLNRRFDSEVLAMGIYGMINFHVMIHLVMPEHVLNSRLAEDIVRLFLTGAGATKKTRSGKRS